VVGVVHLLVVEVNVGAIEQSLTSLVHELLLHSSIVGIEDHHGVLACF
jgi:hypothetical protein